MDMTGAYPATTATTDADRSWRLRAALPLLVLVGALVVWNAAAFAVDETSLEQGSESWGYAFGSVVYTILYGLVALVLSLVMASVAQFSGPQGSRPWVWVIAAIDGLFAVAMVVGGVVMIESEPLAGVVFGVVTLVIGLALLVPLALCFHERSRRTAQSLRSRT